MSPKPPSWSLPLLLHAAVFLVGTGCQDEATQIHRVTAIRSSVPFAETVSNVVAVLQTQGCSTAVSNGTVRPESEQNARRVINFRSITCSGAVTVEARIWGVRKAASITYAIQRERVGTEDAMKRLSEKLDSLGSADANLLP